ncbi:hypothetical protein SK803_12350 [Lentzea sp. BCCO 10_0856]|uniref:Uncharacterized protein n=1 Tax=Lentzea miocenica TaxID=3095431 RepID=A0ABU4SYN1_9PSEU|nr:hypothetical protein [Lentzea sp. BCCO 10_0856]MDX8031011.1 hypothetical protein [Lentzea sp. BCCO 10_0856]
MITIIDGWLREPQIRAFMLTILAMVLIGLVLIVGLASGALGALINTVLPSLTAKVIAMTIGTTLSGGAIAWTRRRRVKRRNNPADTAAPTRPAPSA